MLRATCIELQFSRPSILELVRTSLVMNYPPFNPLLPPSGEVLPIADDGTQFVVLSTSFLTTPGGTVMRHGADYEWSFDWHDLLTQNFESVAARRCEVTQRVRIDLARREKRPDGQLQDVEAGIIEGTLVVDLSAMEVENVVFFVLRVAKFVVETPDIDPRALMIFQHHGLAGFPHIEVPLPWGRMAGQSTAPPSPTYNPNLSAPHVQNCGVAYTDDLSAFAIRIQVGGQASPGLKWEWIDFHAGRFPNRLRRPDNSVAQWGVLLSPALVQSLTIGQTEASLAEHSEDFRLISGVGAQWAPDGSVPYVRGSFDGTVLIFCRPHYHVTFDGRLEITSPNNLVSTGTANWHGDTWDLVLCEVEAALAGGVLGAAFGASVGGPLGGAIGFTVGVGVGFIGGIIAATEYTPDMSTDMCTQDGNTLTCTRVLQPALSLGPGLALPVALTSAVATEDGLVMTGNYQLPIIPALRVSQVLVEVKPFDYTELPVNCGNLSFGFLVATSKDVAQFTHAQAIITLRYVDDDGKELRPPAVTATLVSPDPGNVFPPSSIRVVPFSDRTVIYISPILTQTTPVNYWSAPYGCDIRVNAIVATRTVSIPAPMQLSAARRAQLHERAQRALSDCLAKQKGFGKHGGRFDVEWLVDPGPDQLQASRLWQVGVLGLDPVEQLRAEDLDGRLLAAAPVAADGLARLTVLTAGGTRNRRLILQRLGGEDAAAPAQRPDVRLKQTKIIPHGVLVPGGLLRSVSTLDVNGRLMAAAATTTIIAVYDVTFSNAVRGYFRADAAGVSGMNLLEAGVAMWGPQGLMVWSFDRVGPRRIIDRPVHAAAVSSSGLLVMTEEHLFGVARDGARVTRLGHWSADAMADLMNSSKLHHAAALRGEPIHELQVMSTEGRAALTVPNTGQRIPHVQSPWSLPTSQGPASYATGSQPTNSLSGATDEGGGKIATTLEYYGVGSTLLVPTADRTGLQVFGAAQSVEA